MVKINRIYTKTGDDGTTGLGSGERLPKHHLRIASYGTIDELSSVLGLLIAENKSEEWLGDVRMIQNELFDAGADLCVPGVGDGKLRVESSYTARLEQRIDVLNADLAPLTSFVLPGGSRDAALLHVARTICRRAERLVSELTALPEESGRLNPEVLIYLNRLSDLFFVMARCANTELGGDVVWKPGGERQ